MSLFDTIRYPVVDIFNDAEMSTIPRPIMERWLEDVVRMSGTPTESWAVNDTTRVGLRVNRCVRYYAAHSCQHIGMENMVKWKAVLDEKIESYKAQFTQMLRAEIAKYDNV